MRIPVLLFSDHPASSSGLGRICRDLALRIAAHLPEFKVATLGAGHRNPAFPFTQFQWHPNEFFLPFELPMIAHEWANDEPLILFTIHDIQRMLPIADPAFCPDDNLAEWIKTRREQGKLKLWGYFPIDAHNKDGGLSPQLAHTLTHYDRILVPSEWARGIIHKTLPFLKVDVLPHGIDTSVFYRRDHKASQDAIGGLMDSVTQWPKQPTEVADDALWVGIVATNQNRKDWGLGIEVVAELKKTRPVFLWAHTDRLKNDHGWSILELISDFGLLGCSMVAAGNVSDDTMAVAYSSCDITLGIGRGEGYGFPVMESWSCGVPCIAGNYGAHAEYIPDDCCVPPSHMHIEGPLNLLRPIFNVQDWVDAVNNVAGNSMVLNTAVDWNNLWQDFAKWFKDGL